MKKSILLFLIIILCSFMLISCSSWSFSGYSTNGSYSEFMATETSSSTTWNMKYKRFNGIKSKTLTIKEGEDYKFTVDVVTENGELDLSIKDENGNSIYTGTVLPTSTFEVIVDTPGKYEITLEAKKHKGSFSISCEAIDLK